MDAQPHWQSDSGINAVLAAWHHRRTQHQHWVAAALIVQGFEIAPFDTRIEPGTGLLGIEGQEPGVVEKQGIAQPEILIPANIINFGDKVTEGQLIAAVALPWFEIFEELGRNPQFLYIGLAEDGGVSLVPTSEKVGPK
jgi:hypothetical protein